ncbi:hypothetical protein QE152_g26274 [Popillia japonica]|uniref:Uncharacterized protein n=1 Tax=Popillia japonica TaxID=7064 RepID=A0AAW1JZE4_POPJA
MGSVKRIINRQEQNDSDSKTDTSVNVNILGNKVNKSSKFEDVKGKFNFNVTSQPSMHAPTLLEPGTSSSDLPAKPVNINDFFSVDISNRYGVTVLADTAPDNVMDTLPASNANRGHPAELAATQAESDAPVKNIKPPPICFVSKISKNLSVFREYCNSISKTYYFHFASDRTLLYYKDMKEYKIFISKYNRTLLYYKDMKEYKIFISKYKDVLPFYTYTPKKEKTYAYLIKGLHASVECEDNFLSILTRQKRKRLTRT